VLWELKDFHGAIAKQNAKQINVLVDLLIDFVRQSAIAAYHVRISDVKRYIISIKVI